MRAAQEPKLVVVFLPTEEVDHTRSSAEFRLGKTTAPPLSALHADIVGYTASSIACFSAIIEKKTYLNTSYAVPPPFVVLDPHDVRVESLCSSLQRRRAASGSR